MRILLVFWSRLAAWLGLVLAVLFAIALLAGEGLAAALAHLPAWAALACVAAAFPAGVGIARLALPDGPPVPRALAAALVAVASASLASFLLANAAAPAASRWMAERGRATGTAEAFALPLSELRRTADAAVVRARGTADAGRGAERWREANALVWHLRRRTTGALLPTLFGVVGLLAGFWARRAGRLEVRQAQLWGIGLLLVAASHLAAENGYELLVLRMAGPVFWAGDLALVAPALLALGLGWPTAVTLLDRGGGAIP